MIDITERLSTLLFISSMEEISKATTGIEENLITCADGKVSLTRISSACDSEKNIKSFLRLTHARNIICSTALTSPARHSACKRIQSNAPSTQVRYLFLNDLEAPAHDGFALFSCLDINLRCRKCSRFFYK